MQTHNLQQGSEAWHQFRSTHFGASEAAAMLGLSKYKTRSELLHEKHTGLAKEHSELTQAVFARGHETEAMARPLIEAMIGEPLSPVTCSDGNLSCSCDGITFEGDIAWEHKQDNNALFSQVARGEMPEEHMPQCQQVLMITGAKKLIFTVSNGTPERMTSIEVYPDPAWFERIRTGWAQFERDLAAYVPPVASVEVIATPIRDLPALSIQVQGSISLIDNLSVFGARLTEFVANINKEPTDDQGFADAEAAVKTLQAAQDALEAAEASALAQTSSIDEMRKTVKLYADTARTTRLMLEKMVKARKESIRDEIVQSGKDLLSEHIATLNKRLGKPYMPIIAADFAGAIKGKKTLASLREAVNNEFLRAEREANAIADKIEINLNSLRELAKDHSFLFSDATHLVMKANDDLVALIKVRIAEHQQAEAAKQEALRAKIQAEEEAKAKAKVEAKAGAPLKPIAEQCRDNHIKHFGLPSQDRAVVIDSVFTKRPSNKELIECIAQHFGVSYGQACDWVLETAEAMKEAA